MAKLKVDIDVLENTIKTYDTEISNLQSARDAIKRSLATLKSSGWNSNASKAWFSLLDDEWIKNVDYQIRVLDRLKGNLVTARDEYVSVYNEQEALKNYL